MKKPLLILFGVGVALVLLEGALQVASYLTWRSRPGEGSASLGDARDAILCIGDSFTFGLGAETSEGSYPRRLSVELEKRRPGEYRVVNAGRPGRNSRELLERLGGELADHRPSDVMVLIGTNDAWSLPDRLDDGAERAEVGDPDAFPWRWRTLRLARLILQPRSVREEAPFVGAWRCGAIEVRFEPDGALVVGERTFRWERSDDRMTLRGPDGAEFEMTWRLDGEPGMDERLHVDAEFFGGALTLERARPADVDRDPLPRGATLDQLRERFEATRGRVVGEALINELVERGDSDGAIHVAAELIRAHPHSAAAQRVLVGLGSDERHRLAVLDAVAGAIEELDGRGRALWRRVYANLRVIDDPRDALRQIVLAYTDDRDRPGTVQPLRSGRHAYPPTLLEEVLAELEVDVETRAELITLYREIRTPSSHAGVLRDHLHRIVQLCREEEATPWVIHYPRPDETVDAAILEVATALECRTIDPRPRFTALLRDQPYESLFIEDGHLNDAGYEVLASLVADALTERP